MTTKQIPVWIDCDTGTDDSVAIMLAHALPELSVVALSAVAGNSPLYNTFPNTRRIVHLLGADYPVYPGAERPLVREPHVAGKFHGENGLGDVELPLPDCAPETTPAWDALYEAAKRMPGELRLVATGPLTNVAIALTKYPELKTLLHSIALMGGAAVGPVSGTPGAVRGKNGGRFRGNAGRAYARQDRHRSAERQKIRAEKRARAAEARPRSIYAAPEGLHPNTSVNPQNAPYVRHTGCSFYTTAPYRARCGKGRL